MIRIKMLLFQTLKHYDMTVVQEIRDSSNTAFKKLFDAVAEAQ